MYRVVTGGVCTGWSLGILCVQGGHWGYCVYRVDMCGLCEVHDICMIYGM